CVVSTTSNTTIHSAALHDALPIYGELEYLAPVHLQMRSGVRENIGAFRYELGPARHVEVLVTRAVRAKLRAQQSALLIGPLDDDRAGAVAEQDASAPVGVVDVAGEGIDTDDQRPVVDTAVDELRPDGQGRHETGARRPDIEGCGIPADLRLD